MLRCLWLDEGMNNAAKYSVEYLSVRGQWLAIGSPVKSAAAAVKRAQAALAASYAGRELRVVEVIAARAGAFVPKVSVVWPAP